LMSITVSRSGGVRLVTGSSVLSALSSACCFCSYTEEGTRRVCGIEILNPRPDSG
jgi:hypothetical protein